MTSTGLFGDILLPAATWYEKHDLSSTDMHPYVHAFTPAIDPPWETKSDYDIFQRPRAHGLGAGRRGISRPFEDLMCIPLIHDTPDEMAVPGRRGAGTGAPARSTSSPATTAPKFIVVERDYTAIGAKMSALGPLLETLGTMTKGVAVNTAPEVELLRKINGVIPDGPAAGRPALVTAAQACEAILTLSGTTNGRVAVEGFRDRGGAHRPGNWPTSRWTTRASGSRSPTPRPGRSR